MKTKFEREIKRVVYISQFISIFKSYFGQLAIEYKMVVGFTLFYTSRCRILAVLPILCIAGFKRRKKWISLSHAMIGGK